MPFGGHRHGVCGCTPCVQQVKLLHAEMWRLELERRRVQRENGVAFRPRRVPKGHASVHQSMSYAELQRRRAADAMEGR